MYSYYKLRSIFRNSSRNFRTNIQLNISSSKWPILSYLASLLVVLGEVPDKKFVHVQLQEDEIYPMVPVSIGLDQYRQRYEPK